MRLIDLKTDLKSLRYGNDRFNGGSSGQPFIITPIPEDYMGSKPDFLLRQGALDTYDVKLAPPINLTFTRSNAPGWLYGLVGTSGGRGGIGDFNVLKTDQLSVGLPVDSVRISKFLSSLEGQLFIVKQTALERLNPAIPGGLTRIYNPLNTVTQVGSSALGFHLNKQGETGLVLSYAQGGTEGYFFATRGGGIYPVDESIGSERKNRLTAAYETKIVDQPLDPALQKVYNIDTTSADILLSYNGGPNSAFGLDKTYILIKNPTIKLDDVYDGGYLRTNAIYGVGNIVSALPGQKFRSHKNITTWLYDPTKQGVSSQYDKYISKNGLPSITSSLYTDNVTNILNRNKPSAYTSGIVDVDNISSGYELVDDPVSNPNRVYAFNDKLLAEQESAGKTKSTYLSTISDYRGKINNFFSSSDVSPLPQSPYRSFNRETTYGTSGTVYSILPVNLADPNSSVSSDIINSIGPTLTSTVQVKGEGDVDLENKDLVKFFFEIINSNNSTTDVGSEFLFFRAYINSIGDNFKGEWQSYKYVGRAENFYRYTGFSRDVSLSFTIYAHSRFEMIPLYDKLNRLLGATSPRYSGEGYMTGNFVKLTIGDYFNNTPGIINNISLKPSFEAGWDINRYAVDGEPIAQTDTLSFVGQIPRMIEVEMNFTPIHDFTPKYGQEFIRNITPVRKDEKPEEKPVVEGNEGVNAPSTTTSTTQTNSSLPLTNSPFSNALALTNTLATQTPVTALQSSVEPTSAATQTQPVNFTNPVTSNLNTLLNTGLGSGVLLP